MLSPLMEPSSPTTMTFSWSLSAVPMEDRTIEQFGKKEDNEFEKVWNVEETFFNRKEKPENHYRLKNKKLKLNFQIQIFQFKTFLCQNFLCRNFLCQTIQKLILGLLTLFLFQSQDIMSFHTCQCNWPLQSHIWSQS